MFQRDRVFLERIDLLSFEDLKKKIGLEVGVSKWFTIDQERIDKFADVTEDWQYIHVDPVAAMNTPFNGAIARYSPIERCIHSSNWIDMNILPILCYICKFIDPFLINSEPF